MRKASHIKRILHRSSNVFCIDHIKMTSMDLQLWVYTFVHLHQRNGYKIPKGARQRTAYHVWVRKRHTQLRCCICCCEGSAATRLCVTAALAVKGCCQGLDLIIIGGEHCFIHKLLGNTIQLHVHMRKHRG